MVYAELMGAGLLAGFLAGLLGIGGGFVVVPVLLLLPAFGIPPALLPKVAVATSLAAMVPTATAAVYAQYKRGAIDLLVDQANCSWRLRWFGGRRISGGFGDRNLGRDYFRELRGILCRQDDS